MIDLLIMCLIKIETTSILLFSYYLLKLGVVIVTANK